MALTGSSARAHVPTSPDTEGAGSVPRRGRAPQGDDEEALRDRGRDRPLAPVPGRAATGRSRPAVVRRRRLLLAGGLHAAAREAPRDSVPGGSVPGAGR